MRKRLADMPDNKIIIKKEFSFQKIDSNEFKGTACLIHILEAKYKWNVKGKNREDICILDNNYKWIELYPENENYALTAMFNKKNELIQLYFDVVKSISSEESRNSVYR
jgi:predicted RNA-binding protein associated with RNAse of E/G family